MSKPADLCAELTRGLSALGVSNQLLEPLLAYLELLQRWNRAYNLTAVRDPFEMIYRHLLDSLAIAPYLPDGAARVLDVGTGAGLPGVPLALFYPGLEFHLLDSNGKKTRFLFQVKTALGLENVSVHQARVETFTPVSPFDAVVSRAFASLADMLLACSRVCAPGGRFYAMKGTLPAEELAALPAGYQLVECHRLRVPGLEEHRHLIELTHQPDDRG